MIVICKQKTENFCIRVSVVLATLLQAMINFLHPQMQPKVWCSAVPDDGYLPENLISPDPAKYSLGFMTYPVEKPPVDLIFELCCSIQLQQLTIWTRIGSLKTTGLEVFVQSTPQSDYIKIAACYELLDDILIIRTATDDSVATAVSPS